MNVKNVALVLLASAISATAAHADNVPYPSTGTVAPTVPLTASATGNIIGSFVGYSASDTDEIRLVDLTSGTTSAYFFTNNTTTPGATANFGSVKAGDTLAFEIPEREHRPPLQLRPRPQHRRHQPRLHHRLLRRNPRRRHLRPRQLHLRRHGRPHP